MAYKHRPVHFQVPRGDSRQLWFGQPRDSLDGSLVDPGAYDDIKLFVTPASEFEPYQPTGAPVLTKSLDEGGLSIDGDTKQTIASLSPSETAGLAIGLYVLHLRFERSPATAHSVSPYHLLEIVPTGAG